MTEAKTDTKTKAVKQRRGKVPRAVAENAAKEAILHLRLERADHDALEALVLSTGLDRSALTRLVLRAGIRVAENDPRDLLAPKVRAGGGIQVSQVRAAEPVEGGVSPVLHTAANGQVSVATKVANDASKPRTKPTKG